MGMPNPAGNGSYLGYVCSTQYLSAHVPIKVTQSISGLEVTVDEHAFNRTKQPMKSTFLNETIFDRLFINETSDNHLKYLNAQNTLYLVITFLGPLQALEAQYNSSVEAAMSAHDLIDRATFIKQQFFSEVLLSVWSQLEQSSSAPRTPVAVSITSQRLVVRLWVGIIICALFFLFLMISVWLLHLTRASRRPLQLRRDPNSIEAAVLAMQNTNAATCFEGADTAPVSQIELALSNHQFIANSGAITRVDGAALMSIQQYPSAPSRSRLYRFTRALGLSKAKYDGEDWRPPSLRRWMGTLLVVFLTSIVAALTAMYNASQGHGLYQRALVAQTDVKVGNYRFGNLAPYSIIPTLVAVFVKLWWEVLDDAFRTLMPFLSALNRPQKASRLASFSYAATPILWVSAKAAKRKHWLLTLVTLGTFTSEALQVFMSALWTRDPGHVTSDTSIAKTLEIRTVPHIFHSYGGTMTGAKYIPWPNITPHLYGGSGYQSSWLFSALAECAYNSSPHSFSKDGWTFAPIDLDQVNTNSAPIKVTNSTQRGVLQGPTLNMTYSTQALSGRVACSPIPDSGQWMSVQNLSDPAAWDVLGNPKDLDVGYELSNHTRLNYFTSFANQSTPSRVSIGQWLPYGYGTEESLYINSNFTVLWINASFPRWYDDISTGPSRLIFSDKPQVAALNCMTILEAANASVTVSVNDGSVQEYKLLDQPRNATEAWIEIGSHWANETEYRNTPGYPQYNDTVRYVHPTHTDMTLDCRQLGLNTKRRVLQILDQSPSYAAIE